jgi:hypothetical protein
MYVYRLIQRSWRCCSAVYPWSVFGGASDISARRRRNHGILFVRIVRLSILAIQAM